MCSDGKQLQVWPVNSVERYWANDFENVLSIFPAKRTGKYVTVETLWNIEIYARRTKRFSIVPGKSIETIVRTTTGPTKTVRVTDRTGKKQKTSQTLLVSVFHVVSAATPHPILSQILWPARPRAAARVQTPVPAGAGHRVRYAGRFDRLHERRLPATCNRHEPKFNFTPFYRSRCTSNYSNGNLSPPRSRRAKLNFFLLWLLELSIEFHNYNTQYK